MKCIVRGCPGSYKSRKIRYDVKYQAQPVGFDRVPAEVCNVCGDVLLEPETVHHLEKMLRAGPPPTRRGTNLREFE